MTTPTQGHSHPTLSLAYLNDNDEADTRSQLRGRSIDTSHDVDNGLAHSDHHAKHCKTTQTLETSPNTIHSHIKTTHNTTRHTWRHHKHHPIELCH